MKNRIKTLLLVCSTLLLASCNNNSESKYVYPEETGDITFDYSYNGELENGLKRIPSSENMTNQQLMDFLNVIIKNDYYANYLEYTKTEQDFVYAENDVDILPNSFKKIEERKITRNNETNSLSGTLTLHDEAWSYDEEEPTEVIHKNVDTTGKYSLTPNAQTEIGKEVFDYEIDSYDLTNSVGYSQQIWMNKMNLTQSSEITKKFNDVIDIINDESSPVTYESVIKCDKASDSSAHVELTARSSYRTLNDSTIQTTYYVSVEVTGGLVAETIYRYSEIESTDTEDFVMKLTEEKRVLKNI